MTDCPEMKLQVIKDYEVGQSVKWRQGAGRHDRNDCEVEKIKGRNADRENRDYRSSEHPNVLP